MRCPWCGYEDTKVIDSRSVEGKKRRRRNCTQCGKCVAKCPAKVITEPQLQ